MRPSVTLPRGSRIDLEKTKLSRAAIERDMEEPHQNNQTLLLGGLMIEEHWDQFVIYVNAYYAVQEAYDSARRNWEKPAEGLKEFCRDANPFLWDSKSSAEEAIYEDFSTRFLARFDDTMCTPEQGYEFVRSWLHTLEGDAYGTDLVAAFDHTTNERAFKSACGPVYRQLASRASFLERTPQDEPMLAPATPAVTLQQTPRPTPEQKPAATPSASDIDAVIALLARGDADFEKVLRARLNNED